MKPLIVLLAIFAALPVSAQKLSKFYSARYQEGGSLYFFHPNEDFRNTENRSAFHFDVTYQEGHDQVIVNFTTFTPKPQRIDSIVFIINGVTAESEAVKLFLDFEKRNWMNRYSASIPLESFVAFVNAGAAPTIRVVSDGYAHDYQPKPRRWRRYAEALQKIFVIIDSRQ